MLRVCLFCSYVLVAATVNPSGPFTNFDAVMLLSIAVWRGSPMHNARNWAREVVSKLDELGKAVRELGTSTNKEE